MKIFSADQIRSWDAYTIFNEPVSSVDLMERAATACVDFLKRNFQEDQYIVFCGTGNNGGDGLAIARLLLQSNKQVRIYILEGENKSADFITNQARLQPLLNESNVIEYRDLQSINKEAILIDALFGTGLSRPLEGVPAAIVQKINSAGCTIVSIDLPSGLFPDACSVGNTIVQASHTISFQNYKLAFLMGENSRYTGHIHILDIGLHSSFHATTSTQFYTIDKDVIGAVYKPRDQFGHKYNFGHALLYAGSRHMMGAAVLCAKACLRAGAGLVTVQVEDHTQQVLQAAFPEAITSTERDWKLPAHKKAAIGIGPGISGNETNESMLAEILAQFKGALVIDATALQLLKNHLYVLEQRGDEAVVLTPHTGEFERLFGKTDNDFERMHLCSGYAKQLNCYIILKGHHTLVACPDGDIFFNINGNAGMATAGSGDVLTGLLTGLLAQGYKPKQACILGVYLHGMAGDLAAENNSQEALIASDIIACIGAAFKQVSSNSRHPRY